MSKRFSLSEEDFLAIESKCRITDTEVYAVTYAKIRTKMVRTIHVFARKPSAREMTRYEGDASKLKIKGRSAEVEGGSVAASEALYRVLIHRVYDLIEGRRVSEGPLDREAAISRVDPLTKRAALKDLVGEVFSASQISEQEGDDLEDHTTERDD